MNKYYFGKSLITAELGVEKVLLEFESSISSFGNTANVKVKCKLHPTAVAYSYLGCFVRGKINMQLC